ncbi:MAG: helix-turn-helix domain-containing protein [Burkholderiaceae bacterium]
MSSAALPAPGDSPDSAAGATRAPRRARGRLRVEALLASAAEVFAQRGFDAATMTEIAARADSSIGSLYQFFRTKNAVAEALVQTQMEALWRRFDALSQRAGALSTPELGRALACLLVDFRSAHPSFATLVEMPGPPLQVIAGARLKVRERVGEVLARHAPAAERKALRAMAPVVQHTMKIAIQLRADLDGAERAAAMRELEAMLTGFLVARLGRHSP